MQRPKQTPDPHVASSPQSEANPQGGGRRLTQLRQWVLARTRLAHNAAPRWLKPAPRWWPALAVAVLLVAAGLGWWGLSRRNATQATNLSRVYVAARGNLTASVACTGEVFAPRTAALSFDVSRIPLIELSAAPGRKVKAKDVLARIDPTTLQRAVSQAEADLTVAQDALDKARNPYTALDLMQARLTVSQAELGLEDARVSLLKAQNPYAALDVLQARLAVTQAQASLMEMQDSLGTVLKPDMAAVQSAARDAAAALKSAQSQLVVTQNDMENTARLRTLEYEENWYRNNYWAALEKFKTGEFTQQKLDFEYSNMLAATEKLKSAQVKAESSLSGAQNTLTKAQEADAKARADLAKVQKGPDALGLTKAQSQTAQAEYALAKARADLAKIEAGPDAVEVTRARNAVAQNEYALAKAKADLARIEAGPLPKDVEVARAKVVGALAALEAARAALQASALVAPFDGTVISVGAAVGDLVSSGTAIVTLADLSNLRVNAIVDETDIGGLAIGQAVAVTFDAFAGRRLQGKVLEVPLQGELTQNILTYKVPVSLQGIEGVALKPGMTANLSIVVGQRQNALLVPVMAVQQADEGSVVQLQTSERAPAEATRVEVGLSDGAYVEVTRGLNEGDRVVVKYQSVQQAAAGGRDTGPSFSISPAMPGGRSRGP